MQKILLLSFKAVIGYAFAKAENSGVIMAIEEDIAQSIEAEIGGVFSGKVIQLKIA